MMNNNVISFDKKKSKVNKNTNASNTFSELVEKDLDNLSKALNSDQNTAMKVAKDFYRKYPMLIEHVRSPENLLRE